MWASDECEFAACITIRSKAYMRAPLSDNKNCDVDNFTYYIWALYAWHFNPLYKAEAKKRSWKSKVNKWGMSRFLKTGSETALKWRWCSKCGERCSQERRTANDLWSLRCNECHSRSGMKTQSTCDDGGTVSWWNCSNTPYMQAVMRHRDRWRDPASEGGACDSCGSDVTNHAAERDKSLEQSLVYIR